MAFFIMKGSEMKMFDDKKRVEFVSGFIEQRWKIICKLTLIDRITG